MSDQNQGKAARGSQFWLQKFVNDQPELLNNAIVGVASALAGRTIEWVSPLSSEGYREYQDQAFLKKLGVQLTERPLEGAGRPERTSLRQFITIGMISVRELSKPSAHLCICEIEELFVIDTSRFNLTKIMRKLK